MADKRNERLRVQASVESSCPLWLGLAAAMLLQLSLGPALNAVAADDSQALVGLSDPGPRVAELGEPQRLFFEGQKTFSAEAILRGLKNTPDLAEVSHPCAPRDEYLKAVRHKLLLGYQHHGFPEARITAQADSTSGKVLVRVEEGPRFICGSVKVMGTDKALAAAIKDRLTVESVRRQAAQGSFEFVDRAPATQSDDASEAKAPGSYEALWVKGKPAHFSEYDLAWLKWQVAEALRDRGFFFSKVNLAIARDGAKHAAELRVSVVELGPRRRIDRVTFVGNETNSAETLLRFLDLRPGAELTREMISRTEDRLWRSARFVSYKVNTGKPDTAGRVAVQIELNELSGVPVDQEPSPVERALLQTRAWLGNLYRGQQELTLEILDYPSSSAGLELILSPRSGLALFERETGPSAKSPPTFGFALKPRLVELYSQTQARKLIIPSAEMQFMTHLSFVPDEARGGLRAEIGAEFNYGRGESQNPYNFKLTLSPVACAGFAYETNGAWWFDGGTLVFTNAYVLWKSDARSGRVLEVAVREGDKNLARVRFELKAFQREVAALERGGASLEDAYLTNAPLSSSLAFVLKALTSSKLFERLASTNLPSQAWTYLPALFQRINVQDVLSPIDQILTEQNAPAMNDEEFVVAEIGQSNPDSSVAKVANSLIQFAGQTLPPRTWPWTLAREAGFVLQARGKYTGPALQAIYESDRTGPIGFWVAAELLLRTQPGLALQFVNRGNERLGAADFRRDCELFLAGDCVLSQCLVRLAHALSDLNDEDIKALATAQSPACEEFLHDCARRLRGTKGQPVLELIAPALDVYWEKELKGKTMAALKRVAMKAAFSEGMAIYRGSSPDYARAVALFSQAAELGSAEGQHWLGHCFLEGTGVRKDEAEASKWFRKAAEQGNAEAQNDFGDAYRYGRGVTIDPAEAVTWYRKAAEQGNAEAQRNLGFCCQDGRGVPRDEMEAAKWFRKAAEQGNADAQTRLGSAYLQGMGLPKDPATAVKWFRKAADQGDIGGQMNLGFCYGTGTGVVKNEVESFKWFLKAANQGEPQAQTYVGAYYQSGTGVAKDERQAVEWLLKAARQGNTEAQNLLANCYRNGIGVPKDEAEADRWLKKAEEHEANKANQ
jgi:TPR repeat protein